MSNAWIMDGIEYGAATSYGASLVKEPISKSRRVTAGGALYMVVDIVVSGVTVGSGITAILQSSSDGFTTQAVDAKSVAITADGIYSIRLLANDSADWTYLPLRSSMRVVVTTGAGSALTVNEVRVIQEQ
jgi:hypothetical protein